ncbi:MAG: porin family protein [Alphaproteobacteria bacterium]|nr:porin family protein [Alphaproteobacteria bacterium]
MRIFTSSIPAAAAAAAVSLQPAHAQTAPPAPFTGPRVEAVVGTDARVFFGGGLGYDLQRGKAVFGLEAEADFSSRARCQTLDVTIGDRLCERGRRDLSFGGRAGLVLAPGTLLYAKLGYTSLRPRVTYDGGSAGGRFRWVDRSEGVRVGAGLEQRVGRHVYVKGEYRYSDYEGGGWKHDGVVGIGVRF